MSATKVSKPSIKPEELLAAIVDAIQEKKAHNIVSLEIGSLPNAVCKYFVLCSADSTTQVGAIAENVEDRLIEKFKEKVFRSAGYENSLWVVLDYIDVVVHVFQTEQRDFYRLEELWADAKIQRYDDED